VSGVFAEFIEKYLKDTNKQAAGQDDSKTSTDTGDSFSKVKEQDRRGLKVVKPTEEGEKAGEKLVKKERIESGKVKKSVFATYFKACGYAVSFLGVFNFVVVAVFSILPNVWLSDWSNDAKSNITDSRAYRLSVFAGLGLLQCFANLCKLTSLLIVLSLL